MNATTCAQFPHTIPTSEDAHKQYRRMAMDLFNKHARAACRNHQDAEDGEQEAFAAICQARRSYIAKGQATFSTHVYWTVFGAVTHFAQKLRTKKCYSRPHASFDEAVHRAKDQSLSGQAHMVYIDDIIEGCTDLEKTLLRMTYVDGLSSGEIAKRRGCCSNAVRDGLMRARKRIKEYHPQMGELLVA